MARDYYEVLGVSRDADADELQRAFRTLARRHHPDISKSPDAEERFKEVNEAYHVLSDPETRRRYDRYGADYARVPEGYDREPAGAGSPSGRSGGWSFRPGDTGGGIDLEDLFGDLFGGTRTRGGPSWTDAAGADREAELTLTVEEAYRGGRRTISLRGGRSFDVDVPAGVVDGQRIRLAGQGAPGRGRGPAGDLYLVVRIAPDPRYRIDGRDITVDLPISPWEATLGAEVPVDTPGGRPTVAVPPGSSSGRKLRLRGQGMPSRRGQPGDLYAVVKVSVPGHPSPRERELFEELAKVSTFDPRRGR